MHGLARLRLDQKPEGTAALRQALDLGLPEALATSAREALAAAAAGGAAK